MSYENYYDNLNGGFPEPPPPKHKGRIALLIILVAVVCFVSGILIAGLVQSARQPYSPFITGRPDWYATPTPNPRTTATPALTPLPTERPMVDLDGVAPFLSANTGNPIPDIIDAVAPGVVGVINYTSIDDTYVAQGQGSGFFISSEGYVLTNAHVVKDAQALTITLLSGEEFEAELVGADDIGDVAVLKVENANVAPLALGDSEAIRVGEYVVTIGNPLGRNYEGSATMGIISAYSRAVTIDSRTNTYIQTDAAINVGNSGGPLINMKGEVIGINTAKSTSAGYDKYGTPINAEGIGFALPINKVRNIVIQLVTRGYVEHAALGVHIRTMQQQELAELDIKHGIGVVSVVKDSPAERAGLLTGDIILYYDGLKAEKQDVLVEYVGSQPMGARITLVIWRDGEELQLVVDLVDMSSLDYNSTLE